MTERLARVRARRPRARARHIVLWGRLAVVCAAACLALAAAAGATVYTSFDFETPSYGGFGRRMADHQLLKVGSTWHLFYTELKTKVTPQTLIGHASSTDLVHWTERPPVITQGAAGWCTKGTWAPHVAAAPGGGWTMLFTGDNDFGSEVIGALTSGDLDHWQLAPENPVFFPTTPNIRWGPDFACDCRDPFVYFENGTYVMLYTALTNDLPKRPMIGRAESLDLLHWNDAGPFAVDSLTGTTTPLESSSLVFGPNRVELHFTRSHAQMLTAPTSAGPWDFSHLVEVEPRGGAAELVRDGPVTLMSRLRYDTCLPTTAIIVIDTVTANATSYTVPGPPVMPPSWTWDGDAFGAQPTYGDGPALRGDVPAQPEGLRWLASGEILRQPGEPSTCVSPSIGERTGWIRSPRFTLLGDLVTLRIAGKTQPDSLYAALVDDCTGLELTRAAAPGTSALVPISWSNAGRRGWPVRVLVRDDSSVPDGVIGVDAIRDTASGTPTPPAIPRVDETAPAGGENLTPGSTFTIRWTGSSSAGIDSFLVFVSYDDFATPPTRIAKRNSNQFTFNWTVPAGPKFNAKIRVAVYAKNGIHTCDQSGAFTIGAGVGIDDPVVPAGVALAAKAQPGPAPVLEWRAPPTARAVLELYDVRGRRVRRLFDGPGALRARTTWDGRNDAGDAAPPGLYFALLSCAGERATTRFVLVR